MPQEARDNPREALRWAIGRGSREDAAKALAAGASAAERDLATGETPLHWAADWERGAHVGKAPGAALQKEQARRLGIMEELLAAGADPGAVDAGKRGGGSRTPLETAIKSEWSEGVKALLAAGADPNRRRDNGSTPLLGAVRMGSDWSEGVKALLKAGADPSQKGWDGRDALECAEGKPRCQALLRSAMEERDLERWIGPGRSRPMARL